jgi:hypothetical protein
MDIEDLIKRHIKAELAEMRVAIPGIVESFDATNMTVDVNPAISTMSQETETPMAMLVQVPIMVPNAGGFTMSFPIKKGDECIVIFSDKMIDGWQAEGGIKPQGEKRQHHISDGMAIIGMRSTPNQVSINASTRAYNTSHMEIRNDSGTARITFQADGLIEMESGTGIKIVDTEVTIQDSPITAHSSNITVNDGNITVVGGDVVADGISLKEHTHAQGADSDGNSQVDTGSAK